MFCPSTNMATREIFSWHVFTQPSWGTRKKTHPGPPTAPKTFATCKNPLVGSAGRSCLASPRTRQLQELPSYHRISLASQVLSDHRFNIWVTNETKVNPTPQTTRCSTFSVTMCEELSWSSEFWETAQQQLMHSTYGRIWFLPYVKHVRAWERPEPQLHTDAAWTVFSERQPNLIHPHCELGFSHQAPRLFIAPLINTWAHHNGNMHI